MSTVAIMVDALKRDYIERGWMPWLRERGSEGIGGTLIPPFGFEPDAAYFSGIEPAQVGGGVAYAFSPQTSPFRFAALIPAWFDRLPGPIRRLVRYVTKRIAMTTARTSRLSSSYPRMRIPFRFMSLFDFAEPLLPTDPGFAESLTIFDYLRAKELPFLFYGAPVSDVRVKSVVSAVRRVRNTTPQFTFLHIGDLDWVGHRFGPETPETEAVARRVDGSLRVIVEMLARQLSPLRLLVFGDHGMVPVTGLVDLTDTLRRLPGRPLIDHAYFIDSTFARFWVLREHDRHCARHHGRCL